VLGQWRPMCCAGCQAVAEAIAANGLESWYTRRAAAPKPAGDAGRRSGRAEREGLVPPELASRLLDDPLWQQGKVECDGDRREAALLVEGMVCPACAWLIERRLAMVPGVSAAAVNYAAARLRVSWDVSRVRLSEVVRALAALGYRSAVYSGEAADRASRARRRDALWRLFVAALGMMQVMMYAVPVYLAGPGDMSPQSEALMRWAGFVLTLPVMLYSAAPFFAGAMRDLRRLGVGMDVPVSLGIAAAFAASVAALGTGGPVYFDSICMFVFLLLGSRYLELIARDRSRRWLDRTDGLASLEGAERIPALPDLPAAADRAAAARGPTEWIPLAALAAGDRVLVRRGAVVPADGLLEDEQGSFDESLMTGESRPVGKEAGAGLIGGSVNLGDPVVLRVTRTGDQTTQAQIRRLVERAAATRPRLALLADRFAAALTVLVLVLAAATLASGWRPDPAAAIEAAVAVLVVTCPCALALAAPLALTAASARLAAGGVVATSADALGSLARVSRVVFDKTGTLTDARIEIESVQTLGGTRREEALALAGALESSASHPVGRALAAAARELTLPAVLERAESAAGVTGSIGGRRFRIGSLQFVPPVRSRQERDALAACEGGACVVLADEDGWIAVFALRDRVRDEARAVLDWLARAGIGASILSGDAPAAVERVAAALGIADARAGLDPAAKREALMAMQRRGEIVAMVGDGVNDAPVLRQADCGIAIAGAAGLARLHADLILTGQDLRALPRALDGARRMRRVLAQNLAWAFGYNIAAVPLAAAGLVPPWLAGIGMAASSLAVVLNSMRLLPGRGSDPGPRRAVREDIAARAAAPGG